jgi:hypothetical protein
MLPINVVENHLSRAEREWRLSRCVGRSAVCVSALLLLILVLGILAALGTIPSMSLFALAIVVAAMVTGGCWIVTVLVTLLAPLDRNLLASTLERAEPRLLDRVHTSVHLERSRDPRSPLLAGIAQQSAAVLTAPGAGRPHLLREVLRTLTVLVCLVLVTALFYTYFRPLDRIRQVELATAERLREEEQERRLNIPDELWLEEVSLADPARQAAEEEPWTEIRIRDPGSDVRASRFDLIPLVVEAYSTDPIQEITLTIHIRGRDPEVIRLPATEDPHYALHEYDLDLFARGVADWDVISYFAESTTGLPRENDDASASQAPDASDANPPAGDGGGNNESSAGSSSGSTPSADPLSDPPREKRRTDIYFVDVLPAHEELEQLPGGPAGPVYQGLQDLTNLVRRQQNVLRGRHREPSRFDWESAGLSSDEALTQQQTRLAQSARELADQLAVQWEEPESPADRSGDAPQAGRRPSLPDELRETAQWLQQARELAETEDREALREHADVGLSELARLRSDLARQAAEQPERLVGSSPPASPPSDRDDSALEATPEQREEAIRKNLDEMERRRQETHEAREFIKETLRRERELQRQASPQRREEFPKLAEQQETIRKEFDAFCEQHGESLRHAAGMCRQASHGMERAAAELENGRPGARQRIDQVASQLQEIDNLLEQQQHHELEEDLELLREMLENRDDSARQSSGQADSPSDATSPSADPTAQPGQSSPGNSPFAGQTGQPSPGSESDASEADPSTRENTPESGDGNSPQLSPQARSLLERARRLLEETLDLSPDGSATAPSDARQGNSEEPGEERANGLLSDEPADGESDSGRPGSDRDGDPLRDGGDELWRRAARQLEGLRRRQESGRPLEPEQERQMREDAISRLSDAVSSLPGTNRPSDDVLSRIRQELEQPQEVLDWGIIRELVRGIQEHRREVDAPPDADMEAAELTNVESTQLPPAYRRAIERYYQKLSDAP